MYSKVGEREQPPWAHMLGPVGEMDSVTAFLAIQGQGLCPLAGSH